ncbi:MAG: efflux RND transporter periplasmic adaptor subunit [Colwellia sp.]|nr:efflux RND transporter periplasmic adaptor subunit [Colwellia sp.]
MDTKRQILPTPLWKKYWKVISVLILIAATFVMKSTLGNASFIVEMDELIIAEVKQGDFKVNVRASGLLKPINIRWVSSQVAGRVEQVFVKAGAKVKTDDVLVELSDPDLHRELEKTSWEVKAIKAENHAALVSLESQMVDLQNVVIEADFAYQMAELKLNAETLLMQQGNATVSALDYKRSQLAVKQKHQFWQAQQSKAEKMTENIQASKTAQLARIGAVENSLQRVQAQVDALIVRATMTGVVQQVSLLLGERAQVGDSVALIADQQSLYAELQVQEIKIAQIALGQKVIIDTRSSEISGQVMRIDPAVKNGMVKVDIEILNDLPAEARPELTVDGLIETSHIQNALYVKRPAFAPSFQKISLYKLSQDKGFASKMSVNLGQSSVSKIQIISGLNVGDSIIVSDTTSWQEHKEIMIN